MEQNNLSTNQQQETLMERPVPAGFWRRNRKRIAAGVVALAVVGSVAYFYPASAQEEETQAVYKETPVTRGDITAGISETGNASLEAIEVTYDDYSTGSSDDESNVKTLVEEVYVKAGQRVEVGDPIAKLSTEDIEEELEDLQQSYKEAELALEQAKLDQQSGEIEAQTTLETRLNDAENAELNYELALEESDGNVYNLKQSMLDAEDQVDELEAELEELKDMGDEYREDISNLQQAISDAQAAGEDTTALEEELAALEEEYQDYKDNLSDNQRDLEKRIASAKSTRDSAQLKYEIAVNGMSLDQYNAQVEMETALGYEETAQTLYEIEIARLANTVASKELALEKLADQIEDLEAYLTDGQVKATYAGLVMNVNVVAGDKVSANDTLATIANEENVYIGLAIDQEDIGDITLGKEANVYFDAYPDEKFTGVVDSMSVTPAMSASSTVSYNIQVKLSGDTNKLYQGMTGTVTFITKEVQDVIMVSNRAVFTENGKSYVKIKNDDGSISAVEVETGFSNGNMVEIISGLEEGQTALIESKVNS